MLGQELARRPGSSPPIRSRMSSLRSRTISRFAARSSGRHRPDRVAHAGDELVEHLLAEPLDELVEPLARLGLEEVVLAQVADPLADVARQRVELVEPLGGDVAQHRRRSVGVGRLASAAGLARAAAPRRRRSSATISSSSRRMSPRTSPSSYRSRSSSRRRARRSMRSCRPARSGRVGSPLRQPRSISRRRASARSPSAMTSSDSASRISSASRSGDLLAAVPARVAGATAPGRRPRRRAAAARRSAARARRDRAGRASSAVMSARSPVVDRAAGDALLVEPPGEMQALEQELDRRGDDGRLLGARRSRRTCPGRATAVIEPGDLAHPGDVLARRGAVAGLDRRSRPRTPPRPARGRRASRAG